MQDLENTTELENVVLTNVLQLEASRRCASAPL